MPSPYGQYYNFASGNKRYNPGKNFDKYVEKKGKKNRFTFELRDGYESRFLGKGENQSTNGALAIYTNDYDDLHDDYNPDNDRSNYGIFATAKTQTAAPVAAAAPGKVAAPQASSPAFDQRISEIGKSYAAETTRLTNLMAQQQKDYDTRSTNQMNMFNQRSAEQQAAFDKYSASQEKKISNLSNSVANSASQYDPTKNMSTSNNINPALTIQEKGKDLTKGTQRYNRNSKLNITNVNV